MSHHEVFYYGGRYPVQTLISPKPASTSMDLRDESGDMSSTDSGYQACSQTYNMATYHQSRLHNIFSYEEDPVPSSSTSSGSDCNSNPKQRSSSCQELDDSSADSSSQNSNCSKSTDDSNMDFEVYHTSLVKNALAPCPLQVPIDDNCFCPRATSTPTMSPENSRDGLHAQPHRSTTQRKPVKRKLQFSSEDDEAVFYLQAKYLSQ